ncbi:PD40 domain-containing protein [Actinoplanes sichuanensis]|uniref:TolB family protein n=1 Tax=Actinoplanes sichuanensis TaxID=512349 RepID=A0ABW4AP73_9ACTN|nr:hypothetical protein [Actinoplanes sichuanensis]BEL06666.1 PD40 domain-containing protein [Actinoplanes sichuanensis]
MTISSGRVRMLAFVAFTAITLAGSVGYVADAYGDRIDAATGAVGDTGGDPAAVATKPHVVFRNTAAGPGAGHVALVTLDAPGGARAITPAVCDRVYATRARTVCLAATATAVSRTYRVSLLDRAWVGERDLDSFPGLSSRTRLARDSAHVATTAFVFGDSYNEPGRFSTRTTISDVTGAGRVELEDFEFRVDGRVNKRSDRNFWGVTFAPDGDTFYATAASAGRTWLVRGSLSARTLTALHPDVECPSLSPDATRVAYKKHGDLPDGQWRLAVLDLRTGRETVLSETRSVDDQAEWLDDEHVLYGLQTGPVGNRRSDVWAADADGGGSPRLFIENAWSPAVVR